MRFAKETDLCTIFMEALPAFWVAYPETAGFDMVLVHRETGAQIGIEAKLKLNAKVLLQAAPKNGGRRTEGPDFRAVLVPVAGEIAQIADLLGITVITAHRRQTGHLLSRNTAKSKTTYFRPDLPKVSRADPTAWFRSEPDWFDLAPLTRCRLPDYVPEVPAGASAPITLSEWTIRAIKVCIWVERTGTVTRAEFAALRISPGRWMTGRWLKKGAARGIWVAGPDFPAQSFRARHPGVFAQIEADWPHWSPKPELQSQVEFQGVFRR